MNILLEKENGLIKHSFFCVLNPGVKRIHILNAGDSPYEKGWQDYAPFESADGKVWTRVKNGDYKDKVFSFEVTKKAKYACWFPPYDIRQMKKECHIFQKKVEGAFFLGDKDKKTIVLMAGLHPGETMGLYFLEGILKSILSDKSFLDTYSILVFPYVNKEGIQQRNHRLTPSGIDLNRDWKNSNNVLLNSIKKQVNDFKNLCAVIDIHGDEVSKQDYVIYNKFFQKSFLKKHCERSGFVLLKRQSFFKKFIKALIRQHKIIFSKGQSARDYFEKRGVLAITVELSAIANTPTLCIQKGMQFFRK